MAELHKSVAPLRIFGDTLDPDNISKILGRPPTKCSVKGQIRSSGSRNSIHKTGSWLLEAPAQEPANLDAQISDLFAGITTDLGVWANLSKACDIDLFCGFFMSSTDEGMEISSATLKILGDRGIKLGFCIYAPLEDENTEG
jgi:hypothetical protein